MFPPCDYTRVVIPNLGENLWTPSPAHPSALRPDRRLTRAAGGGGARRGGLVFIDGSAMARDECWPDVAELLLIGTPPPT